MKIVLDKLPADQRPITLKVEPEMLEITRHFASWLEAMVLEGARFSDEETIQLGWSFLMFREAGKGLEACEPDFQSMPIRWVPGINNTTRHAHLQRAVCGLFDCEPEYPQIAQAGIASSNFIQGKEFVMFRSEPAESSDSGWAFHESDSIGSGGSFFTLYHLALLKPAIIPFLALPPLTRVSWSPGRCEVTVRGIMRSSEDAKLLRNLTTSFNSI